MGGLSDQCPPLPQPLPVLPTGGGEGTDCTAIILVENIPVRVYRCLPDLTHGFYVPIGTIIVLASASHLGRCGVAAYAGDVVAVICWVQEAYGGNVRVIHGFPIIGGGLVDDGTVHDLREVELWLAEVDRRCLGSLPLTSNYFIQHFLSTQTSKTSTNNHRNALRLPVSLHSYDTGTFISLGWEDLPRSRPILGEQDERSLANNADRAKLHVRPAAGHLSRNRQVQSVGH